MEAVVDLKYQPVFPNGGMPAAAAKKTRLGAPAAAVAAVGGEAGVYRECLKNHAATLGGHALDGCGEFMPSPEADPADPSSLRCAACGCHRNFHRRLLEPPPPPPPPLLALPPPPLAPAAVPAPPPAVASHSMRDGRTMMRGEEAPADDRLPVAFDEETEESDDGSDFDEDRPLSPLPAPAMPPHGHGYRHQAAAPHMLLALRTGAPSPGVQTPAAAPRPPPPPPASSLGAMPSSAPGTAPPGASAARKRFRTKFSPEQKQRMQALSERLGWRLQKRDEAVVDECCQEMGVTKGVFKVWMHNNKHNFVGGHSARRSSSSASAAAATAIHHPSDAAAGTVVYPSSSHAAAPAPSATVHPSAHAAAPARAAPVHADFNINGTAADAADYFRVQPSAASGGSPQSS